MIVRRMESAADIARMIALGRVMHAEGHFGFLPYDEVKLQRFGEYYRTNPECLALLVEDDNKDIFGMFMGYIGTYYFCEEKYAADLLFYVRPDRRGGLAGARMMKQIEAWAAEKGAREIVIIPRVRINSESTLRFFTGLGFDASVPAMSKRIS